MKKILLTGATDGIGLEAAKLLAEKGHHLLIHGRSESKLLHVQDILKKNYPASKIEIYKADLSSFDDLRAMLASIIEKHESLNVIINNAGVLKAPNAITQDGLDIRFVVNTFAPYIIAQSLLPMLAEDGRIVNLSSAAQSPVDIEAMQGKREIDEAFQAYAQSKLAITLWSVYLAKLVKPTQVVVAVNPGSLLASKMVKEGFGLAGNDLSIGANILLSATLSAEFSAASGLYFDNDIQAFSDPHPNALDEHCIAQVMGAMEEMVDQFYGPLV